MKPHSPVAVTGMGGVCAAGLTLESALDFLFEKSPSPVLPTRFSNLFSGSYPVFEAPEDFWHSGQYKTAPVSRSVRLVLTALAEALDDAGLRTDALKDQTIGICIGSNVAGAVSNKILFEGDTPPAYLTPARRFSMSSPAVGIAKEYETAGPIQTVVTACSAGGDAIGLGAAWIRRGLCDIVIAGGVDELYEITYNGFISLMNSDDTPCKPFDARRKGLNLGEGAAVMILESAESVSRRKIKPRGFVRGYGAASDAYHLTTPHPEGKGLKRAAAEALETAGLKADDIAFINAHGTGTPDNDRIESRFFDQFFPGVPFLSTKGFTGHTLGAAGALEAAFTLGCLERGKIPPCGGFKEPDPELPVSPVSQTTDVCGHTALSETLAFGGNNAVLAIGLE